ncbi:MAG: MaoC family dehydratase N-terminal domain-containing protein [Alphaproteobacteria bacterium]
MKSERKGQILMAVDVRADAVKLAELAAILSTPTSKQTASVSLFFGPTVAGSQKFVEAVGLDLRRALLGGHEISWTRPFVPDEPLKAELRLAEHTEKNGTEIGVVETRFTTPKGELVQTQRTTFIERALRA